MLSTPLTNAKNLLIRFEGLRLKPYQDSAGKLTIGAGRCLDTRGISEEEAMHLLANDIVSTYRELGERVALFNHLDDVRQLALVSMAFNLGVDGLLGFKNLLAALLLKHYDLAAEAALDSKWARQVGHRAVETAEMLRTGELQLTLPID